MPHLSTLAGAPPPPVRFSDGASMMLLTTSNPAPVAQAEAYACAMSPTSLRVPLALLFGGGVPKCCLSGIMLHGPSMVCTSTVSLN